VGIAVAPLAIGVVRVAIGAIAVATGAVSVAIGAVPMAIGAARMAIGAVPVAIGAAPMAMKIAPHGTYTGVNQFPAPPLQSFAAGPQLPLRRGHASPPTVSVRSLQIDELSPSPTPRHPMPVLARGLCPGRARPVRMAGF